MCCLDIYWNWNALLILLILCDFLSIHHCLFCYIFSLGKNKTAIITWYLFLLSNCIHSTGIIWVSHHYLLRAENSVVLCNMFPPQKSFFFVKSSSLTAACEPHSPSTLPTLRFFWLYLWHVHEFLLGKKIISNQ